MRDKKRAIDKFVTLNVQQISATLEQVGWWAAGRQLEGDSAAVGFAGACRKQSCAATDGDCWLRVLAALLCWL
jgi:hypothetical protein